MDYLSSVYQTVSNWSVTDKLAAWGAVLSTFLALIQVIESVNNRRRIVVDYSFKGLPEGGHRIILSNPGKTPILITHYELFWSKWRYFFKKKYVGDAFPEDGPHSVTINDYSRVTLTFSEMNYFNWTNPDSGSLYIRLHITGAKFSKIIRIYKS